MILFAITFILLASGWHTDLEQLDDVREARRSLADQDLSIFTTLMVGDPQYHSDHCSWSSRGTANYARTDQAWCQDSGPFNNRWLRTNNYMNAVKDALFKAKMNNRLPVGANILGDLTEYGWDYQKESYESKIHSIQGEGPVRIWQSLGNHDTTSILRAKDDLLEGGKGTDNNRNIRDMIQKMKELLPQWHSKSLNGKSFHDGVYHYDTRSNSFLYRKNQIMFINLQLHPAMHHIDYWCKDCRDHAGHYHVGKWKQVLYSPIDWFKDRIHEIQNDQNGMTPVKGIVLMYHYDRMDAKTSNGGDTVDSQRWNEVYDLMEDHNQNTNYPPFIAVFNGHIHNRCGYKRDDALKDLTKSNSGNYHRDIPRFYAGSADYNCFLTVKFRPKDEYFVVYANYFDDSNTGARDVSYESTGFKRRCVHQDGLNKYPQCTRWYFNGKRTDFTSSNA